MPPSTTQRFTAPVLLASICASLAACGAGPKQGAAPTPAPAPTQAPKPSEAGGASVAAKAPFDPAANAKRFVEYGWSPSVVLGIARRGATPEFVAYGAFGSADPRAVDTHTYYPIGSITKVFTGLLLASAVERNEVSLDEPLGNFKKGLAMEGGAEQRITLRHLTTHRSGLPPLPAGIHGDLADPYARFKNAQLWKSLRSTKLDSEPGTAHAYSNFGVAVLGAALEARLKQPYAKLVRERILIPLGLSEITFTPPAGNLAREHSMGSEVPHWNLAAHAPAGALYATAEGLLRFGQALLDPPADTEIARVIERAIAPISEAPPATGYGWFYEDDAFWHSGATAGAAAMLVVDRKAGLASVVLSNDQTGELVTKFGFAINRALTDRDTEFVVEKPVDFRGRQTVELSREQLDMVEGVYALAPEFTLTVAVEGEQVFVQATGQGPVPMFAAAPDLFFLKAVVAEGRFVFEKQGEPATKLIWIQNGSSAEALRLP